MTQSVPAVLIGGYLGAGKTTLVNHLLRHANGRRIAVLVNDFGEVSIDADLIVGAEGGVLSLAGGCVCCSFGSDLVGTQIRARGVITALPGELAEPLLAALSDPTEGTGLFVLLPSTAAGLSRGQLVEVSGFLTLRRQALTLAATAAPLLVGNVGVPLALTVQRPAPGVWAWETWEGRRIRVEGVLAGNPTSLANGAISLRIRLGSGEELLAAASSSVASTLPTALQEGGRRIRAEGLIHQRGSVGGGGYRLWLDPVIGLTSAPQTSAGGEVVGDSGGATAPVVPDPLPLGAPTIAVPEGAGRGWLREIVTSLRVEAGRLELWREGVIRLVVLPSCGEPVDHEGEAPYPEPR